MTTLLLTDPVNPRCVINARSRARNRLSAVLRGPDLDRALALGVSPDTSAVLSLRANSLIGARTRSALARSIRMLIADAQHPMGPLAPCVPICRRKVLRSRESLEELADRLVRAGPVDVSGVAQASLLLCSGCGPVYDRPTADDLEPAIQEALQALELTA